MANNNYLNNIGSFGLSLLFAILIASGCDNEDTLEPVPEEEEQSQANNTNDSISQASKALKKAKKYFLSSCFPYYYW